MELDPRPAADARKWAVNRSQTRRSFRDRQLSQLSAADGQLVEEIVAGHLRFPQLCIERPRNAGDLTPDLRAILHRI